MRERLEVQRDGRGLAVVFRRVGDRYEHGVSLLQDGGETLLLTSREGAGDEAWPSSPPLQQLALETRAAGQRVALAVGMAGSSHWSLSLVADSDPPRLTWEVACRCGAMPTTLGSEYTTAAAEVSGSQAHWQAVGGEVCFAAEPEPSLDACRLLVPAEGLLRVVPAAIPTHRGTARWKYTLSLEPRPSK